MKKINSDYIQYYLPTFILLLEFLVRLFFQVGHIFSDDAYYTYLSYTLVNGDFAKDFLGYPVFPLRMASATTIYTSLRAIDSLKVLLAPFLPFTSERLDTYLAYTQPLFGDQLSNPARTAWVNIRYCGITTEMLQVVGNQASSPRGKRSCNLHRSFRSWMKALWRSNGPASAIR